MRGIEQEGVGTGIEAPVGSVGHLRLHFLHPVLHHDQLRRLVDTFIVEDGHPTLVRDEVVEDLVEGGALLTMDPDEFALVEVLEGAANEMIVEGRQVLLPSEDEVGGVLDLQKLQW